VPKLISLDLARQLFSHTSLIERFDGMTMYQYVATPYSLWSPVFRGKQIVGYEGRCKNELSN
jgi:hypothetical protein